VNAGVRRDVPGGGGKRAPQLKDRLGRGARRGGLATTINQSGEEMRQSKSMKKGREKGVHKMDSVSRREKNLQWRDKTQNFSDEGMLNELPCAAIYSGLEKKGEGSGSNLFQYGTNRKTVLGI